MNKLFKHLSLIAGIPIIFVLLLSYTASHHKIEHKYNVTYSFLYTNGMMGFADSTISSKCVGDAINEGKLYLMTNNGIMHPVLLNITELK